MKGPMDNIPFTSVPQNDDIVSAIRHAQQDPLTFEENLKRNNPQAYQMACQIRNSSNPRQMMLQLAKSRGVNPNVLKMFGII